MSPQIATAHAHADDDMTWGAALRQVMAWVVGIQVPIAMFFLLARSCNH